MKNIFRLNPTVVSKVWGGQNLAFKDRESLDPIGETWEVSDLKEGPSYWQGKPLYDLSESISGMSGGMEYLVKLIDTSDHLSIQVHPNDEYSQTHHGSLGKSECWIILGAEEGCGIYVGFKEGCTQEDFEEAISSGKEANQFLNFYEVTPGEFFFIPAGTIHAIGKGVTLAEVQQSSGVTYRVWDWNRLGLDGKPRELHVDHAFKVLEYSPSKNSLEYFQYKKSLFENPGVKTLCHHKNFNLQLGVLAAGEEYSFSQGGRPASFLVLNGEIEINYLGEREKLAKYEAALMKFGQDPLNVVAKEESQFLYVY